MHVLVTGGTGFIGTALCEALLQRGDQASVLTRSRERARAHFRGRVAAVESLRELDGRSAPEAIVNLAGANIGRVRWNAAHKQRFIQSRVETTRHVVDYIRKASARPHVLISGSAVGYYGARGDEPLEEDAAPGDEYQAHLCQAWEAEALAAEQHGVRVCISRTGAVMGPGGGPLAGLVPQFRRGLGASVGSGRQWLSWIHLDDLLRGLLHLIREPELHGAFNNTSPCPVTNRHFARVLGAVLHRPVPLRVPGWLLRIALGEMAHLYLTGQRVIPSRHLQAGFRFHYPDLRAALAASLDTNKGVA